MTIACTLSAAETVARRADTAELARRALRARRPVPGGALLTFAPDAECELRDIVAAEAQCCAFLYLDLRRAGDALELEITGPDEAGPILDALFA